MTTTIRTLAARLAVDPEDISVLVDQIVYDCGDEAFVFPLDQESGYYDLPLTASAVSTITDQIKSSV